MSPTIETDDSKQEAIVFRGKNFNIFKLRIQAKLRSKGLWTIVSGDITASDAASTSDFDAKEAKAFAILVNALDDDNLAYVAHVTTSAAVWKFLIKRYEARTYADVSNVIHELHTKTYEVGKSIQTHITDMRILQQKLMYMGTRVNDDMLEWILDSGCTTDVTGDKTLFSKLTRSGQVSLRMANDTSVKSTQSGSVKIRVDNDQILDRPWVMYVPGLTKNLLSLRRLLQDGFAIP
ncbi:unnamed protein product, partial [Aphanomyces euteiches]